MSQLATIVTLRGSLETELDTLAHYTDVQDLDQIAASNARIAAIEAQLSACNDNVIYHDFRRKTANV